ncbi:MAG: peroxiredoxin family protein, partial [Planctomycetota bacterium]
TDFKLTCGIQSSAFGDRLTWSTHYKNDVTSEDGTFNKTWSGYHITLPFDGTCCLKVEAKGYLPGAARPMKLGEKYEPCVVRLTRADPLEGMVVDGEGNPAAQAQVGWVGPERYAFIKNGKFDTMGYSYQAEPIVKADSDGTFELPPSREQGLIVAVHKSGYASVESKDFENGSQIQLTRWARIEGTIVSARQKRGEFVLSIYQARPEEESESQQIRWMFDRTSFTGDSFVIDFVPSTPLNIGRVLESGQYNPAYLDPQPGQTCEVRFGDEGIIAAGKKMPSLLGKPLPDLSDIAIVFSPEQHKGKMILVCFWDMHQRPSRNCIDELAGQAEQLAQKGVTVVAIQALKMDEKALDKWVRENGVPFPVGTVRADHEKTRTAWGVKSFPWLILTDADHIVSAEGFAISELDDKLK